MLLLNIILNLEDHYSFYACVKIVRLHPHKIVHPEDGVEIYRFRLIWDNALFRC